MIGISTRNRTHMTTKIKNDEQTQLAGLGQRFLARLIDGLVIGCITAVLFSAGREPGGGLGLLIGFVYEWYFLTQKDGQTPGKSAMGIRVVKVNGTPVTTVDAAIRYLGYYLSSAFILLGLLWAVFDNQRRTWHDLLAGTLVLKV